MTEHKPRKQSKRWLVTIEISYDGKPIQKTMAATELAEPLRQFLKSAERGDWTVLDWNVRMKPKKRSPTL